MNAVVSIAEDVVTAQERRELQGYKATPRRASCSNCVNCNLAVAPVDAGFDITFPVICRLGDFRVDRSGLCYSWSSAS